VSVVGSDVILHTLLVDHLLAAVNDACRADMQTEQQVAGSAGDCERVRIMRVTDRQAE
jgi:hypothetical protein